MSLTARVSWPSVEDGRTVWYRPGDQIPEDHPKREWLIRRGIAVDGDITPDRPAKPAAPKVESTPNPGVDEEPVESGPVKPKRAASVDAWRTYAEAQGVDVKGMSKQEIIAATR